MLPRRCTQCYPAEAEFSYSLNPLLSIHRTFVLYSTPVLRYTIIITTYREQFIFAPSTNWFLNINSNNCVGWLLRGHFQHSTLTCKWTCIGSSEDITLNTEQLNSEHFYFDICYTIDNMKIENTRIQILMPTLNPPIQEIFRHIAFPSIFPSKNVEQRLTLECIVYTISSLPPPPFAFHVGNSTPFFLTLNQSKFCN